MVAYLKPWRTTAKLNFNIQMANELVQEVRRTQEDICSKSLKLVKSIPQPGIEKGVTT